MGKSKEDTRCSKSECCRNTKVSESDIREEAYRLWEEAGRDPNADPDSFWYEAKERLCKK